MDNKILISDSNLRGITREMVQDLLTRIKNKDLSLPYTTQITKSAYLKIDGNGNMFLCNNGQYVPIPDMTKSNVDINEIYKIFNITTIENYWTTGEIPLPPGNIFTDGRVIECNGKIYCIGGNRNTLNLIYDITTKTWSTGAPIPLGMSSFGIQVYNNKIYCIGGIYKMNNEAYNTVYIYDIATNSWSSGAVMPGKKHSFACGIFTYRIYCMGGYHNTSSSPYYAIDNSNFSYNIGANTWDVMTSMPQPVYNMGFTSFYNSNIYCIGGIIAGSTYINTMYIYSRASNTWSTGPAMPTTRYLPACILYGSKIYAIGGANATGGGSKVEIFDIIANKWNAAKDRPNVNAPNIILYNDRMYSFYGSLIETLYPKYNSFNIPIPSSINEKLSEILSNGDGTKIFHNDGKYRSITPSYEVLSSDQVNDILDYAFL